MTTYVPSVKAAVFTAGFALMTSTPAFAGELLQGSSHTNGALNSQNEDVHLLTDAEMELIRAAGYFNPADRNQGFRSAVKAVFIVVTGGAGAAAAGAANGFW